MIEILKIVVSLSVSASIIALVLFLLKPILKNKVHKNWQYFIWLLVVVRLLVPFTPQTTLVGNLAKQLEGAPASVFSEEFAQPKSSASPMAIEETHPMMAQQNPSENQTLVSPSEAAAEQGSAKQEWNLLQILLVLWSSVAVAMVVMKLICYHRYKKHILKGATNVSDEAVLEVNRAVSAKMMLKKPLAVYASHSIQTPMLLGTIAPVLVLPDLPYTREELRLVIKHELVHFKRKDILYKWLVQIALCIHWFNPLMYLVSREINKDCELACDEIVMRDEGREGAKRYGDILLKTARYASECRNTVAGFTLSETGKTMKERLEFIVNTNKKPKRIVVLSLVLAIALFGSACYVGAYPLVREQAKQDISDAVQGTGIEVRGALAEAFTYADEGNWFEKWGTNVGEFFENLMDQSNGSSNFGKYSYFQQTLYQDGYLFSLSWTNKQVGELEAEQTVTADDGVDYQIAFKGNSVSYAEDKAFLRSVTKAIEQRVTNNRWIKKYWDNQPFIVENVFGPFSKTPDELALSIYSEKKMSEDPLSNSVYALIEQVSEDTLATLLERAYQKGNEGDFMMFLEQLPRTYSIDSLAERAVAEDNSEMLFWMLERLSKEEKETLLRLAITAGKTDVVDILYDGSLSASDVSAAFWQAYEAGNETMLNRFLWDMGEDTLKELLAFSYDKDDLAIFQRVAEYANAEHVREYYKKAIKEGKTEFEQYIEEFMF